jgi:hypothetical protein
MKITLNSRTLASLVIMHILSHGGLSNNTKSTTRELIHKFSVHWARRFKWRTWLVIILYWVYIESLTGGKTTPLGGARVNQHSPMHWLAILFTGWDPFFHLMSNGVHHSPFLFDVDHCILFFWFVLDYFFLDLTSHIPTFLTSYSHKYSTNLGTLQIIPYWHNYPNN